MIVNQQLNPQHLLEMLEAGRKKDTAELDPSQIRYAIYARKSTTDEDSQAHSIKDQIKDCLERVVVPNKLKVVTIYKESFSAKESGTREQFLKLTDDIKMGRINGLISWHPDRLARNMKDAGEIIDLVDKGSIADLRFPTFTFENTAEGKMTLGITFVMAKQYSEHLSVNVNRGNAKSVSDRGEFIGKFKHGYIVDASRRFQPDPEHFLTVKKVFEMVLEGKSQKEAREWINKQGYKVQKRPGGNPVPHVWSKDNVSELLRDPHYAGVHKWGKNFVNLTQFYDFVPMTTVAEFLKINRINNLDSSKVLAIQRPKTVNVKANLFRNRVYCGSCNKTLTSNMQVFKKNGKVLHYRYYYKCETKGCEMENKSARARLVLEEAHKFFSEHLFVTKENYEVFLEEAKDALAAKNKTITSDIARIQTNIKNRLEEFDATKKLLLKNDELKKHYDLDKMEREIKGLEAEYARLVRTRKHSKEVLPTYEKYLKLLESTPVVLGKIRDMDTMDRFLKIFFSNFTISSGEKDFRRGSTVTYKLKEPWDGFLKSNKFVSGAG